MPAKLSITINWEKHSQGRGDEQFLATNTALKKGLKGKLYSEEVNQEDTMNNLFIRTK